MFKILIFILFITIVSITLVDFDINDIETNVVKATSVILSILAILFNCLLKNKKIQPTTSKNNDYKFQENIKETIDNMDNFEDSIIPKEHVIVADTEYIGIKGLPTGIIFKAAFNVIDKKGIIQQYYSSLIKYDLRAFDSSLWSRTARYLSRKFGFEISSHNLSDDAITLSQFRELLDEAIKIYDVKYVFFKGPTATDRLILTKKGEIFDQEESDRSGGVCLRSVYNAEVVDLADYDCVKYEGEHDPLCEIKFFNQFVPNKFFI